MRILTKKDIEKKMINESPTVKIYEKKQLRLMEDGGITTYISNPKDMNAVTKELQKPGVTAATTSFDNIDNKENSGKYHLTVDVPSATNVSSAMRDVQTKCSQLVNSNDGGDVTFKEKENVNSSKYYNGNLIEHTVTFTKQEIKEMFKK